MTAVEEDNLFFAVAAVSCLDLCRIVNTHDDAGREQTVCCRKMREVPSLIFQMFIF